MKKAISILLTLVMIVSMVPITAIAADEIVMNVTIRDFNADGILFENRSVPLAHRRGLVQNQLGADKKPVFVSQLWFDTLQGTTQPMLDALFNDVSGVNMRAEKTLTLTRNSSGFYVFGSSSFFPINNELFGNEGRSRNYHFSLEAHLDFVYQGHEEFRFSGDDDVWVFVDGTLVIDIGGVHTSVTQSASLPELVESGVLNIQAGQRVDLDFFYMERRTTLSNFNIRTNMNLENRRDAQAGSNAPNITTTALQNATVGTAYSQTLAAAGGTPITWSVSSGTLPDGLSLNPNTGAITGTPTTAGTFNFTALAQNSEGNVTRQLSIAVSDGAASTTFLNPVNEWAREEVGRAFAEDLVPPLLRDPSVDLRHPITRVEFAGVVVLTFENLSGTRVQPPSGNPFTDTSDIYARMAYNAGLMVGTSATTFAPDMILNRETSSTALTRVYKRWHIPGWSFPTDREGLLPFSRPEVFADDTDISGWARESVYFMAANGIILGTGNNRFSPRAMTSAQEAAGYAQATREQALIIALRMVENLR